jgi:hypothetical protein
MGDVKKQQKVILIAPQTSNLKRESSHIRQTAKRAGIDIPKLKPSLMETEQEEADCY